VVINFLGLKVTRGTIRIRSYLLPSRLSRLRICHAKNNRRRSFRSLATFWTSDGLFISAGKSEKLASAVPLQGDASP